MHPPATVAPRVAGATRVRQLGRLIWMWPYEHQPYGLRV